MRSRVVDPETQVVEVVRGGGAPEFLTASDHLDGEDVLPGFRCRVGDLFPQAADAATEVS